LIAGQVAQVSSDVIPEGPEEVKFESIRHGAEYLDTSQINGVAHVLPGGLHRRPCSGVRGAKS